MKHFALTCFALMLLAAPAVAQIDVGAGPNGLKFRVGPQENRAHERDYYNDRRDDDRCRDVEIVTHHRNGPDTVRIVRRCDNQ